MNIPSFRSLLLISAFCILPASCSAASFYVDNGVPVSGNGTSWEQAWKNLSNISWGAVNPGDTVYISGGASGKTYNETLSVGKSGASSSPITIRRGIDAGHTGTVTVSNVSMSGIGNVTVQKLHVANASSGQAFFISGSSGGVVADDNDIYTGNGRGFNVRSNTGTVTIKNNRVTTPGNTTAQTDGIYLQDNTGTVVFEGNTVVISNTDTTGHSDALQTHRNGSMVIRNNIFKSPTAGGDNHVLWTHAVLNGHTAKVYNNLMVSRGGQSNFTYWRQDDTEPNGTLQLWNNTIVGGRAIALERVPNSFVRNNIAQAGSGNTAISVTVTAVPPANFNKNLAYAPGGSIGTNPNGLTGDPQFASSTAYTLQATSPAIDAGESIGEVAADILGIARPQGSAYDIGAYEYESAPGDVTPPSVPQNLTATSVSSSRIDLAWDASADDVGVAAYDVYRNGSLFASTTGTAYANTGLSPDTTYAYQVRAKDAAGNASALSATASATTLPLADTAPPVLSNGAPSGTLPAGTASTTMRLTTNEAATCRFAMAAGTAYSAMIAPFDITGGTSHATTISGLTDGSSRTFYVRCQDTAGNANTADYVIAFSVATAEVTNGLVAWWKLDGNGTNSQGAASALNFTGGAFVAGIKGQARSFNGTSQYAESATSGFFNPNSGDHTVLLWMRPTTHAQTGGKNATAISQKNSGGTGRGWIGLTPTGQIATNHNGVWRSIGATAPLNAWTHVALVHRKAANALDFYVNGAFAATLANASVDGTSGMIVLSRFKGNNDGYFGGQLDDVRIYNRALSGAEIATIGTVPAN